MISEQKLTNDQLMNRIGSKNGWDPIPPSQYLHFLTDSDPQLRLLAWVQSKTLRQGHRSPFCVNEKGKPLSLKDAAAEFGWGMTHARQTWAKLQQRGLVRMDEDGTLWIRGDVPPASENADEEDANCTISLPRNLLEQIQRFSEEQREQFLAEHEALTDQHKREHAEATAQLRAKQKETDREFYRRWGLTVKYYQKRRTNSENGGLLQPLADETVQNHSASVQFASANLYNPKNDAVQFSHPYRTEDTEDTEKELLAPAVGEEPEVVGQSVPSENSDDRLTDLKNAIPTELCTALTESPSPELLKRIDEHMDGAPPEKLTERISQRRQKIKSLGMLISLADDVAQAHKRARKEAAQAAAAAAGTQHAAEEQYRKNLEEQRELLRSGTWPGGTPLTADDRADILRWFPELEGDDGSG